MSESQKFDLLRLNGGLNQGEKPTHIDDGELQEIFNFHPQGKSCVRRKGLTKLTTTANAENITSLFAYKKSTGVWDLIVGGRTGFTKLSGMGFTDVPHVDKTIFTNDGRPWVMKQYRDVIYGARVNAGTLQRCDGLVMSDAGIAAPSTAPTLAQGAAGDLSAGDFYGVVTFLNQSTLTESDFSTASAKCTIAANKKINWSAIPTSTNSQVDGRALYRTLTSQTGEYFWVAQINDNTTLTYADNIIDDNLGEAVSLDNGTPPAQVVWIEIWRERLIVTDGIDVFASRAAYPEQFSADFFLTVTPDDGHKIRGILAMGDRCLVGKTNATHYLVGTDESDFELHTLSNKHGVASGHSMQLFETLGFWFGGDDFYKSDGTGVQGIGNPKIKTIVKAIPASRQEYVSSWMIPELYWYVSSVPQDESGENTYELVHDARLGTWTVFEHGTLKAPCYAGEFFDTNYGRVIYAVFYDGHIYQWHLGANDAGEAITCRVKLKSFGFDSQGFLKAMRRVNLLTPRVAETLTARLYRDDDSSHIRERTGIDLNTRNLWKRTGLSNKGYLGSTVCLELEYEGDSDFEINGISFEIVKTGRMRRPT